MKFSIELVATWLLGIDKIKLGPVFPCGTSSIAASKRNEPWPGWLEDDDGRFAHPVTIKPVSSSPNGKYFQPDRVKAEQLEPMESIMAWLGRR